MTAEVAVANTTGIALAADSAVTVTTPGGGKVINGANKLFRLNDRLPVAVMFYGNADLSGAPLEALLKHFRSKLGPDTYDSLNGYGDRLWTFIETEVAPFDDQTRRTDMFSRVQELLRLMAREVYRELHRQSASGGRTKLPKTVAREVTLRHERTLRRLPDSDSIDAADSDAYLATFQPVVDAAIDRAFSGFNIDAGTRRRIERCVRLVIRKAALYLNSSNGIVIAGYPEGALYPSIRHYVIGGFVANRLNVYEFPPVDIGDETSVGVYPYAQGEMVFSFMEGIDPRLARMMSAYLRSALVGVQDMVLSEARPYLDDPEHDALTQAVAAVPAAFASAFEHEIQRARTRDFSEPVLDALRFLPKEQLAEVAESFVNLTSFRRRISLDLETVGGAIDVAVISPGDGFVWIRRKHYFDAALNPGFFMRYK